MVLSIGRKRQHVTPTASSSSSKPAMPTASSSKPTASSSKPAMPKPTATVAPIDQSALIDQLRAELAAKNEQLETVQNKLQKRTIRVKSSKRQEVVYVHPNIEEAFIFSINGNREPKMNVFNMFNEWRRCLTTLNTMYSLNPTQETVELANQIHNLMIEADTTEFGPTQEFYSKKQKKGRLETNQEYIKRLNQAYNNYSKAYIVFLYTFGDKVKAHEPFVMAIHQLRETLEGVIQAEYAANKV